MSRRPATTNPSPTGASSVAGSAALQPACVPVGGISTGGRALLALLAALILGVAQLLQVAPAQASPGLCIGPVCADEIARSAKHHWQLRLRLVDQSGHRERITVDCRDGRLSPDVGRVDRAYGAAIARRACRL